MNYILIMLIFDLIFLINLKSQEYDFIWKVNYQDTLYYDMIMEDINNEELVNQILSSVKNEPNIDDFKTYVEEVINFQNNYNYLLKINSFKDSLININLNANLKENSLNESSVDDEHLRALKEYNQRTLLRGSMYKTGEIHSFWLETTQKNLLALMFQLPNYKVKLGDRWSLDLNLIENDEKFICDSSYKKNNVSFVSLKKVDEDVIAILHYDNIEFVKGKYIIENSEVVFGENIKDRNLDMFLGFKGYAEFSITQGKWINFNGFLSISYSGGPNIKKITNFKLKENK